jgi:hypothetical protein
MSGINLVRLGASPQSRNNWIATLSGGTVYSAYSVAYDTSGNIFICGANDKDGGTGGGQIFEIAKFDAFGAIQWQRKIGTFSEYAYGIATDSSGNCYVCGLAGDTTPNSGAIFKYDSSGNLTWQRKLSFTGYVDLNGIAVDGSSNVIVCGSGNSGATVVKYNSSGTLQWQKKLNSSSAANAGVGIDSTGNIYVGGSSSASGSFYFQLQKYDTSGTLQWQNKLGDGLSTEYGYGVTADSSGNSYIVGRSDSTGINHAQIAKYDSSGALLWQRNIGSASTQQGTSVSVDSSGNVYVCGYESSSPNKGIILKYNSSGTIQWQRYLYGTSFTNLYGIAVNNTIGTLAVAGRAAPTASMLIASLPNDGSKTGTYTVGSASITYSASSLTDAAGTLTSASTSLTDAAAGLTSAANSYTSATSTLTSAVTSI